MTRILFLCDYRPYDAAMVTDHINAFYKYSKHNLFFYSGLVSNGGDFPADFELDSYDAVVIHYSIYINSSGYLSEKSKRKLASFSGKKILFIQDEYRLVALTVEQIALLNIDLVLSCVPEQSIPCIYSPHLLPNTKVVNVLTGAVSEDLIIQQPIPLAKRHFDVSYRGRKYPLWHGRLGLEKWQIADGFNKYAKKYNLKTSISYSEEDRLYGARWMHLIQNSRAVLGVESGASVFDFTGEISAKVETLEYLLGNDVVYQDARANYFAEYEDKYGLEQISPRIFEAMALRTLCILFEGNYSGILKPWRHYVPLKKDFSNIEEVVLVLKDNKKCAEIIANAYAEIAINPKFSYKKLVEDFDLLVNDLFKTSPVSVSEKNITTEDFYKKYPFFVIYNPHGLVRYNVTNFTKRIYYKMPPKVRYFIKKTITTLGIRR